MSKTFVEQALRTIEEQEPHGPEIEPEHGLDCYGCGLIALRQRQQPQASLQIKSLQAIENAYNEAHEVLKAMGVSGEGQSVAQRIKLLQASAGSEEWEHHPETDTRLENITVANGRILLTLQDAVTTHNAERCSAPVEAWRDEANKLAMMGLKSDRYTQDGEYRNVVDIVLALTSPAAAVDRLADKLRQRRVSPSAPKP